MTHCYKRNVTTCNESVLAFLYSDLLFYLTPKYKCVNTKPKCTLNLYSGAEDSYVT